MWIKAWLTKLKHFSLNLCLSLSKYWVRYIVGKTDLCFKRQPGNNSSWDRKTLGKCISNPIKQKKPYKILNNRGEIISAECKLDSNQYSRIITFYIFARNVRNVKSRRGYCFVRWLTNLQRDHERHALCILHVHLHHHCLPLSIHHVSIRHKFVFILLKLIYVLTHYLFSIMSPLCIIFRACIDTFNSFSHLKLLSSKVKGWRILDRIGTKNAWPYFQFKICELDSDNNYYWYNKENVFYCIRDFPEKRYIKFLDIK